MYKTRNQATEACKKGQIKQEGDAVKASRAVFPGDRFTVRKNQINYQLEVLDIPSQRMGAKLVDLYRKDLTDPSEFEHLEMLKLAKDHYRKRGTGRPTKKDRRELDGYYDE
jgi:ribosome-associated heat shock protein Hsp15